MTVRMLWCKEEAELGCNVHPFEACATCPLKMPVMRWGDLWGAASAAWVKDSYHWRGAPMLGRFAHWCPDWDYLPIDEDSVEWPCPCSVSDGWVKK